jgi:hypothetical protein
MTQYRHFLFLLIATALPLAAQIQQTEPALTQQNFQMNPLKEIQVSARDTRFTDNLPKSSITVYSTYHLMYADNGISAVKTPLK